MNSERDVAAAELLRLAGELDALMIEAQHHDGLAKWGQVFGDDVDACQRARNNINLGEFISDRNLAAAVEIAKRVIELAQQVKETDE